MSSQATAGFVLRGIDGRGPDVTDDARRVTIVGRAKGCDASLRDHSISELHACLVTREDGVWVHDLGSSNGTRVNGTALREKKLADGDRVEFGKVAYRAELHGAAGADRTAVSASIRNTTTGEVHPLSRPVTVIGRRRRSHIRLPGSDVSRVHALLVRCPDGVVVRDLGSRTGISIDGERTAEALLVGGERLTVGLTELAVEVMTGAALYDPGDPFAKVLESAADAAVGAPGDREIGAEMGPAEAEAEPLDEALPAESLEDTVAELIEAAKDIEKQAETAAEQLAAEPRMYEPPPEAELAAVPEEPKPESEPEEPAAPPEKPPPEVEPPEAEPPSETQQEPPEAQQEEETVKEDGSEPEKNEAAGREAPPRPAFAAADDQLAPPQEPAEPPGPVGMLTVAPQAIRPARRMFPDIEVNLGPPREIADTTAAPQDELLSRQQQRLTEELASLRRQLETERRVLAQQRELVRRRLAEKDKIEKERAAHAEAARRLDTERAELQKLHDQLNLMRESIDVERNAMEVERRGLGEMRAALASEAEKLDADRRHIAEETDSLAAERRKVNEVRSALGTRQDELDRDRTALREQTERLDLQAQELTADRQAIAAERERLDRIGAALDDRESQIVDERADLEASARRLAETEGELARRDAELNAGEQHVRQEAARLEAEARRHAERQAEFERTVAAARAAEISARKAQEDLSAQVREERAAREAKGRRVEQAMARRAREERVVAEAPPAEVEPAEVAGPQAEAVEAAEPRAEPVVPAAVSEEEPEAEGVAPGIGTGEPVETMSATDEEYGAITADLGGAEAPPPGEEIEETERQIAAPPPAEERVPMAAVGKQAEPVGPARPRGAARSKRMTAALIASAVVVVGLILAAVLLLPPFLQREPGKEVGRDERPVPQPSTEQSQEPKPEPAETVEPESAAPEEPLVAQTETPGPAPEPQPPALPTGPEEGPVPPAAEEQPAPEPSVEEQPAPAPPVEEQPVPPVELEPAPEPEPPAPQPEPEPEPTPPAEGAAVIPGGVWPYKAPENLVPGEPAKDLQPTLAWARTHLADSIASVCKAFGLAEGAGPKQAIAIRLGDGLRKSLAAYLPPPYAAEKIADPDGTERDEHVSALVFLEFVYDGAPHLFVMKRRDNDGSVVPGRRGRFLLIPGTIQEHTVVLDPTRRPVPEPFDAE